MFLTPEQIAQRPDIVETTERATLRMVAHAIFLYRHAAREIFLRERDLPSDIAEDISSADRGRQVFRVGRAAGGDVVPRDAHSEPLHL